jgi:soluble lytic murein transglycosylase-like protein
MASAKGFGLRDRFDPFESIRAGGRHLADNLRRWNGNVAQATAHFNIGGIAGTAGFQASQFPYVREVMRVQALIESEPTRTSGMMISYFFASAGATTSDL